MTTRKNAVKTRGRPFQAGNAGRPPGALNKATVAAQTLLDGEAEALTRKAVEMALQGNIAALRLCLERICPPKKERPLIVELPSIEGMVDMPSFTAAIFNAVGSGGIDAGQAASLASLVTNYGRILGLWNLENRIRLLEERR